MLGAICKITKPGHVVAAELCGRSHNTVFEPFPALNPFAPAQWHWTRQIQWFARKITLKVTNKVTLSFWRMNYSQPICLYYIIKTHGWGVWWRVITYSLRKHPKMRWKTYIWQRGGASRTGYQYIWSIIYTSRRIDFNLSAYVRVRVWCPEKNYTAPSTCWGLLRCPTIIFSAFNFKVSSYVHFICKSSREEDFRHRF